MASRAALPDKVPVPHSAQKRAVGMLRCPHCGQMRWKGAPQSAQKAASVVASDWQVRHFILSLALRRDELRWVEPYHGLKGRVSRHGNRQLLLGVDL